MRSRILANTLIIFGSFENVMQWSKGLFQCGAWDSLPFAVYKRIHGAVMYVYRALIGKDRAWALNDDEVICELAVLCPMTFLRARRL